jgi:hypothetical protein
MATISQVVYIENNSLWLVMILTISNLLGILVVVDIHVHCQVVLLYVSQQLAKATKFVSFGIALLPG